MLTPNLLKDLIKNNYNRTNFLLSNDTFKSLSEKDYREYIDYIVYGIRVLFDDNLLHIEKEDLLDVMDLVRKEYIDCKRNGDTIGMKEREEFFINLEKSKALPYDREADQMIATALSNYLVDGYGETTSTASSFSREFYSFYLLARQKHNDTSPEKNIEELSQFFANRCNDRKSKEDNTLKCRFKNL